MEIIQQYFNEAVAEIEKSGNPKAREAAAQFALIILGMEALVVKEVATRAVATGDGSNLVDNAVETLKCADKYMKQFTATGDKRFRDMARGALSHELYLSQMLREKGNEADARILDERRAQLEKVIM